MAGDPLNPFNDKLVQLNGVNFNTDAVFSSINFSDVSSSGNYVSASGSNTPTRPGLVEVVDYTFIAGSSGTNGYKLPVFGIITFSEFNNPGPPSDISNPLQQYAIIGFSENGLLLYRMVYSDMRYNYASFFEAGYAGTAVFGENGFGTGGITFPVTFNYQASTYTACFAEGTPLLTPSGPRPVEDLAAGDMILTAGGEQRPIKWVGWSSMRPARHPYPGEVNPVRIKAHAFAPNVPEHDVRLSPGHAIHIDGVLVPAGHLINGATIVQETVETIRYFHIELDTHDLLVAAGLPCESYLDDGNRASFANSGEAVALHGRLDPKSWDDACAPMVAAGPQLVEIQQRLHARAEELGWVQTEEAGLAIVADGVALAPLHVAGDRYWFALPVADEVVLRSNRGMLSQLIPGLADHRQLGVAVSQLRLDGEAIGLDSDVLASGFHALEQREQLCWRWTDGNATLALGHAAPAMLEVELAMIAPSWASPVPALRVVA